MPASQQLIADLTFLIADLTFFSQWLCLYGGLQLMPGRTCVWGPGARV
jgi:hypothetical protein